MIGRRWTLISFAEAPTDPYYLNKRAEMWGEMKKWLKDGGCLYNDQQLAAEIGFPEAFINNRGKLQLESKADMKARGLSSPGRADSLALTFARKVKKTERSNSFAMQKAKKVYDPLKY